MLISTHCMLYPTAEQKVAMHLRGYMLVPFVRLSSETRIEPPRLGFPGGGRCGEEEAYYTAQRGEWKDLWAQAMWRGGRSFEDGHGTGSQYTAGCL
jgi:hypothetical protein